MKTLRDSANALADGLAAIRAEFHVPADFPPAVLAAAEAASRRPLANHVDRTETPFVTLDPASSTDLDQAFAIERAGGDLLLRYAIADIGWFVGGDAAIDVEAWARGETIYLPDGKAPLYPPVLSQGAASLLPDGPRPAIVFAVRIATDGGVALDGVERAIVRSRAKLAYETVADGDLPADFAELARRIEAAEDARGAARVDPPQQEVARAADGSLEIGFAPRVVAEDRNAAMSLATNMAVADALLAHRTGLFRVMAEPDAKAVIRLRATAHALGLDWPAGQPLDAYERSLSPADPRQAALMLAIRRAGHGAAYAPYAPGERPWHAAVAATYAHATAPLRRLADRYVVEAALAVANGRAVPDDVAAAFANLAPVMNRAEALGGRIDHAVIDLAEALLMQGSEGQSFAAVVTDADDRGARVQLRDMAVVARIATPGLEPRQAITVTLTAADPAARTIRFDRTG